MVRAASLSDNCTCDRCRFSSLDHHIEGKFGQIFYSDPATNFTFLSNIFISGRKVRSIIFISRRKVGSKQSRSILNYLTEKLKLTRIFMMGNWIRLQGVYLRTQREIYSESRWIKPNLDCNHTFPIDLASNWILFGANLNDSKKCDYNLNLGLYVCKTAHTKTSIREGMRGVQKSYPGLDPSSCRGNWTIRNTCEL